MTSKTRASNSIRTTIPVPHQRNPISQSKQNPNKTLFLNPAETPSEVFIDLELPPKSTKTGFKEPPRIPPGAFEIRSNETQKTYWKRSPAESTYTKMRATGRLPENPRSRIRPTKTLTKNRSQTQREQLAGLVVLHILISHGHQKKAVHFCYLVGKTQPLTIW